MNSKTQLLLSTDEQVAFVRKQLGISEADIKEAVSSLISWLHMQPHLPDEFDERRLERMYINCKCSLERTKRALDAYFSLKHKLPELLMNSVPSKEFFASVSCFVTKLMMPGLTPQGHRVFVNRYIHHDLSVFQPVLAIKVDLMFAEVLLAEDYSLGDVIVFDLENLVGEHILKMGLNNARACQVAWTTAYARRVKAIHLINARPAIDTFATFLKTVLPKKLKERVMTHLPGSRTLFDHVPPEFVPNELGGTGGRIQDLNEACYEKLRDYSDWLAQRDQFVSDETKRPAGSACIDDFFGVDGSFKKLSVD